MFARETFQKFTTRWGCTNYGYRLELSAFVVEYHLFGRRGQIGQKVGRKGFMFPGAYA